MGAAVDNEEVSKNLADVFDSNYDDTKFAFGGSIERTVSKFYNLVNSEDDILESGGFTYDCILIMVVELCSHTALYPNSLSFNLTMLVTLYSSKQVIQ